MKAFRPEMKFLKIKAIDKERGMHDVKPIQNSDDTSVLNVKVIMNGQRLPLN